MGQKIIFKNNDYYCPHCSVKLTHILYGLVRPIPEEVERGEAVLGGELTLDNLRGDAPEAYCRQCKREFTRFEFPIESFREKDDMLSPLDSV